MEIRNYRRADMAAVVDFINRDAEARGKTNRTTVEQLERMWHAPDNNPENDIFIAIDTDGTVHGYVIADLLEDPTMAYGMYHVTQGQLDTGRTLMRAAAAYFLQSASEKTAPDQPIMMDWRVSFKNVDAVALCREQNFEEVRQFYTMRVELNGARADLIDDVPLPDGFERRPFLVEDMDAIYAAKYEIFEDHWGGQHDTIDAWHSWTQDPQFDSALWWIIAAGDDIAGMLISNIWNDTTGWVGIVGVKRAWRKRGLAEALLRQCFAEYKRRGFQEVHLGVDTDNSTNAVKVYERAGMHIHDTVLYFRQYLR